MSDIEQVTVGEFTPLHNFEIAELGGSAVEECCRILGTQPPFDSPGAIDSMKDFDDSWEVILSAAETSRAFTVAIQTGEVNSSVGRVFLSKAGGLALRGGETPDSDIVQLINHLNGNYASLHLSTHLVRVYN